MKELTNLEILSDLEQYLSSLNTTILFYGFSIFILLIIALICFLIEKRTFAFSCITAIVLFLIIFVNSLVKFNRIDYSIENRNWIVVTDTVVDRRISSNKNRNGSIRNFIYYIYLENHGKIKVTSNNFHNSFRGDSIYLVLIKNKEGKEYTTNVIYSPREYVYNK